MQSLQQPRKLMLIGIIWASCFAAPGKLSHIAHVRGLATALAVAAKIIHTHAHRLTFVASGVGTWLCVEHAHGGFIPQSVDAIPAADGM